MKVSNCFIIWNCY